MYKLKYSFEWMRVFFSPFITPKLKFYLGKVQFGTPYFLPRRWIENKEKPGYMKSVPKKIGFDFVSLGWKTKWQIDDYRFEWEPMWSFVFFKWQFCIFFSVPHTCHYWECWLFYTKQTDKSQPVEERLKDAIERFPCVWTSYKGDDKETICYWNLILKKKWKNIVENQFTQN
jgi:hypothetical protein